MLNSRMNAVSAVTPDAYGNNQGGSIPTTMIAGAPDFLAQGKAMLDQQKSNADLLANTTGTKHRGKALQENAMMKDIPDLQKPQAQVDMNGLKSGVNQIAGGISAAEAASTAANSGGANITPIQGAPNTGAVAGTNGGGFKLGGKGGGAGMAGIGGGIGSLAAVGGDYLSQTGNETAGGAIKGAGMGVQMGSAFGPWGMLIGGVVGAAGGAFMGHKKQEAREKYEKDYKEFQTEYNANLKKIKQQRLGQADDLDAYDNLLNTVNERKKLYRQGGLLRYEAFDVEEAKAYLESVRAERKKEAGKLSNTPIYQQGGVVSEEEIKKSRKKAIFGLIEQGITDPKQIYQMLNFKEDGTQVGDFTPEEIIGTLKEIANQQNGAPTFKRGGKMLKCKNGCSCKPCQDKKSNLAIIFRRGGKVNLEKLNVIIDGPSHEELNNTGVKGDKGLPVIYNGKKVAEIESDELVINAGSTKQIEDLVVKAKKGDKLALEKLGDTLHKELAANTHDYSNLMD